MEIDVTHLGVAFGLGAAAYAAWKISKASSKILFSEIRFNRLNNEIQLYVENKGDKTLYVKPEIRVVRFTPLDELKCRTTSGDQSMPMMNGASGLIKGYDLIGAQNGPIAVKPKEKTIVTYPLAGGENLRLYDTIKVDSTYGSNPYQLGATASGTVRVTLSGEESYSDELFGYLNDTPSEKKQDLQEDIPNQQEENQKEAQFTESFDGGLAQSPTYLPLNDGGILPRKEVSDMYSTTSLARTSILNLIDSLDEDSLEDEPLIECVSSDQIRLKPRHKKILGALENETTVSAKELANKLERDHKTVATDLRYLMRNELIDRVKIKGTYKYFIIRGEDQVVIHSEHQPGAHDRDLSELT